MPLALILPRGDQWYLFRKPLIKRDKGDTLSLLVQILLGPWAPCAPPLLPCCSPGYPSWQLLNQPFLFYIFFAFHPSCLPRFPRGVYSYFACACVYCVCVCVFIKLHITAQSGPVILVILCHSHWSCVVCVCVCVCIVCVCVYLLNCT